MSSGNGMNDRTVQWLEQGRALGRVEVMRRQAAAPMAHHASARRGIATAWSRGGRTNGYEHRADVLRMSRRRPLPATSPPRHPRPMHDARYRTVFAFPRMVEDLLRGFAARAWAGSLDFSTLQKVPADYVSDERLSRRGDAVWQVRFHDGRPVLVVLEFQSSDDPRMALRILAYTSLLYQELARNEAPALDELGRLPAVLPVVLYNGGTPWRAVREVSELIQPVDEALAAYRPTQRHHVLDERHVGTADLPGRNLVTAVVRLGRIRSPWGVFRVTRMLRQWLRRPEDDELRRVFAAWMREIAEPFVPPGETLPPEMTLEEIEMTVAERAAEWSKQRIQEGRMRGMREGMVQGLAHERTLLRRMAASRFGTETAERLAETLAGITDPECLAEIGEWLVRCETGGEFLARVAAAGTEAGRGNI